MGTMSLGPPQLCFSPSVCGGWTVSLKASSVITSPRECARYDCHTLLVLVAFSPTDPWQQLALTCLPSSARIEAYYLIISSEWVLG